MTTPTESAERWFRSVFNHGATLTRTDLTDEVRNNYIANCFADLGSGLGDMAIALRATYVLLQQVEKKLDQQKMSAR
jgi:hypothetical protein